MVLYRRPWFRCSRFPSHRFRMAAYVIGERRRRLHDFGHDKKRSQAEHAGNAYGDPRSTEHVSGERPKTLFRRVGDARKDLLRWCRISAVGVLFSSIGKLASRSFWLQELLSIHTTRGKKLPPAQHHPSSMMNQRWDLKSASDLLVDHLSSNASRWMKIFGGDLCRQRLKFLVMMREGCWHDRRSRRMPCRESAQNARRS